MNNCKDGDECAKEDGNININSGKKKGSVIRRGKSKMKQKTNLLPELTQYDLVDTENHIIDLFFGLFAGQKPISRRDFNGATSTKTSNSDSRNFKKFNPNSKLLLDYLRPYSTLEDTETELRTLGVSNYVINYWKNINTPMNSVNEVDGRSIKPGKKNKNKNKNRNKRKNRKLKAINSAADADVESSSGIPTINNNSPVPSQSTVKAKVSKKSKKAKPESEKSADDKVSVSNSENPHLLENNTAENKDAEKGSNSKSGKLKKITKGKDNKRFVEHFSSEEIEHISQLGILHSGVIRINQKNFAAAYIPDSDNRMDILVDCIIDRNRALEGDEVYYLIKDPSHYRISQDHNEVQKTAVVVAIKKFHHNRTAVGTLEEPKKNSVVTTFLPRDLRIPKMHIPKQNWPPGFEENPELFTDKLFLAKITKWTNIHYAEGTVLKKVGVVGDIDSETSAIMLMFQLSEAPYSDTLIKKIPPDAATFSSPEIKSRKDFRTECIFTIDPATAKDLDDAVSCKLLPNGNYLVGVHISDVTYYLEEGSALDEAAAARATTVYLVQKVYHMLPKELCELCSLTPGTDKLTFSVIWEITPEAEVVQCDFQRSVINCCGQFSYEQVQDIIEKSESISFPMLFGPHRRKDVVEAITILNSLAIKLREKRFNNGALKIDQTKISFSLTEHGLPESYSVYVNKESHRLIEEFMLLANMAVASRLSQYFPKIAFLRNHSPPSPFLLKTIKAKLQKYNIELDISSSKSLRESLDRCSGDGPDSIPRIAVLNSLLAKTLNRANYYCAEYCENESDRRHYALNVELYTHFTSPIRRYADVVVHRLLAASLGYIKTPNWNPKNVKRIAECCNQKKYAAKLAGEKSTVFFLTLYIGIRGPIVYEAVVCDIKDSSLDYIVLDNGLQQRLYFQDFETKPTVQNVDGKIRVIIHWPETEKEEKKEDVIDIFSVIKIELKKCPGKNKLESKLLRN